MSRVLAGLAAGLLAVARPAVVIGVAAAVMAAPVVSAAAASWSWLNAADDGFTVELPGTPKVKRWDQDVGGGMTVASVEYSLIAGGDEFTLGAANFRQDLPAAQLQAGFEASIDGLIAQEKGIQTWRKAGVVSGRPALEAEYTMVIGANTYRRRVLVTFGGQRLYTFSVLQPVTAPVSTAERALRSLRLI